jgi:hypothetical protein
VCGLEKVGSHLIIFILGSKQFVAFLPLSHIPRGRQAVSEREAKRIQMRIRRLLLSPAYAFHGIGGGFSHRSKRMSDSVRVQNMLKTKKHIIYMKTSTAAAAKIAAENEKFTFESEEITAL